MKNKTIEALEKLVALKDETIKELERQVQLLKNQPPVNVPFVPVQPYHPGQQIQPTINPWNPQFPWGTTIVSTTTAGITNDPSAIYTLTNSDGSTNVIDLKTCSRA